MLSDRAAALFLFLTFLTILFLSHPVAGALTLLTATVVLLFRRNTKLALAVCGVALVSVTSILMSNVRVQHMESLTGNPVRVTGLILHMQQKEQYATGTLIFASLRNYRGQHLLFQRTIPVTISGEIDTSQFRPGDRIAVTGIFHQKRLFHNRGTDRTWFNISRNRLFSVSASDVRMITLSPTWLGNFISHHNPFRIPVSKLNRRILEGMVAGNRNQLPDAFIQQAQNLGIYHLFVVSGFHFGILFSAIYLFLLLIPIRPRTRKWLALGAVTLLLPVTGFSPSALRAWLMISIYLIFRLRDIDVAPLDAVGLAGILLLLWNPYQVGDPGFLLSFLVAGAIVSAISHEDRWWQATIKIPFVAFLASAPLMFLFFHKLTPISALVNLLISPLVIFIFYTFLLTVIGLPLSGILDRALTMLTHIVSTWPSHVLTVWAPVPIIILMFIAVVFAILSHKKMVGFGILAVIVVLATLTSLFWHPTRRMALIPDTGQTQSVILRLSTRTYVFDVAGEWEARLSLIPYLRAIGVHTIDAVFISHFDADHAGGLEELATQFPIGTVYVPYLDGQAEYFDRSISVLCDNHIPLVLLSHDGRSHISLPGIDVHVLHPDVPVRGTGRSNARCLVLKVQTDNLSFLLPGDLDGDELQALIPRLSHCDILIAPHHGSSHAAVTGLREAVSPEAVIVCCGRRNRFHFPSRKFMALWSGIPVLTTAACGEIDLPLPRGLKFPVLIQTGRYGHAMP